MSVAAAGLALQGIGLGTSFIGGRKAAKASKKARQQQQLDAQLQARRERRRVIRQARIARGQTLNVAAQTGASQSSSVAGGLSGLSSQEGAELGFVNASIDSSLRLSRLSQRQANAGQLIGIGQGIGALGQTITGNSQTISGFF
jgi:hypothetical protein